MSSLTSLSLHTWEHWERWHDIDQDHTEILAALHLTIVVVDTQICLMTRACNFHWNHQAESLVIKNYSRSHLTSSTVSPQTLHLPSNWFLIFWIIELLFLLFVWVKWTHFSTAFCWKDFCDHHLFLYTNLLSRYHCMFCIYLSNQSNMEIWCSLDESYHKILVKNFHKNNWIYLCTQEWKHFLTEESFLDAATSFSLPATSCRENEDITINNFTP